MHETLYRWTLKFHKVVRQQNSGAVEDYILPYSAFIYEFKSERIIEIGPLGKVIVKNKSDTFLMAHGVEYTQKICTAPGYAHAPFSPKFLGFCSHAWTLWIYLQNLKFVALPLSEIIGGTQKNWAVPEYAHAPFSLKFFMGLCSDGPYECIGQICSP